MYNRYVMSPSHSNYCILVIPHIKQSILIILPVLLSLGLDVGIDVGGVWADDKLFALNASRPSEHPTVRGENVKPFSRWDHRLQIQNLFMAVKRVRSPMVVTLGQQYNVGEKPSIMLYTYINRHAVTPDKNKNKTIHCST